MAYNKHTWEYGEVFTPTKMNNIENGIETVDNNCRISVLARMTPNSGETIGELIARFRTTYWSSWGTDQKRFGRFKLKIDGATDMIFTCQRWNSNTANQWVSINASGTNIRIFLLSFGGSSTAVRKYTLATSGGMTITDLTNDLADGEIIYFSEDYS